MRATLTATLLLCAVSGEARAGKLDDRQAFALGIEAGGAGRYLDTTQVQDADAWGLQLTARTEVNALAHVRGRALYMEGRAFNPDEDRFLALDLAGRSPRLFIFALDLHELYWRTSTRTADGLTYAHAGLGLVGNLFGSLKGSLGFTYLGAPDVDDDVRRAYGAYAGLEYLLRTRIVDASARAAVFLAFADATEAHAGTTMDADVMVKIPAGPVAVGPRVAVAYRNLGLGKEDLFGQPQEMTATAGLAVAWGTGNGNRAGRRKGRGGSDERQAPVGGATR